MLYWQIQRHLNFSRKTYNHCSWSATSRTHWKNWFQERKFLPKMDNSYWQTKKTSRLIQASSSLLWTLNETNCTSKIMKLIWSWQNTRISWQNEFIYWVALTFFSSGALFWTKQLFLSKTYTVKKECSLSDGHFPNVSGNKIVNWTQQWTQKSILKCLFLLGL